MAGIRHAMIDVRPGDLLQFGDELHMVAGIMILDHDVYRYWLVGQGSKVALVTHAVSIVSRL